MPEGIAWRWLGRLAYPTAAQLQAEHKAAILAGESHEEIWLLEHPPVITRGRREVEGLPTPERLARFGISLASADRGGLATYHGPGQLIAWPHVDLRARNLAIRTYVDRLEEAMILFIRQQGIESHRRLGAPGVWLGNNKLGAVGVNAGQGITTHGLSLNLSVDLDHYRFITPCGIVDGGVTSLHTHLNHPPSVESAAEALGAILSRLLSTF
jgi:lipoyl(octanoyl) transferase